METYGQRVAAARARIGWSQNKLARELGIRQPSLHELEHGPAANSKHSYKIAQKTGVKIAWLETGDGPMIDGDAKEEQPAPSITTPLTIPELNLSNMPRDVPILGGASCGEDGLFELNGQVNDHARRSARLVGVKDVYALYVYGDSMEPWRESGDLVYVHPHQPINIRDYVVVQLKPEKQGDPPAAYIKRLVKRSSSEITLHQFNPARDIKIKTGKIQSIHRIMKWSEVFGF